MRRDDHIDISDAACCEIAGLFWNGDHRIGSWMAAIIAQACVEGEVPTLPVARYGPGIHDLSPGRRPVITEKLSVSLTEIAKYACMVRDLLPERMGDLLASDWHQATEEARLLLDGVSRIRQRRDNVVALNLTNASRRHGTTG